MPSAYRLLVGLAGLAPVLALGTGQKFKIVDGGRSFDRFITIWLENQVRLASPRLASPPIPSALDHEMLDTPMELTARAMTGLRQGRQGRPFRRPEKGGHQPHQILRSDASLTTQLHRGNRGRLLRHEPRRPRSRTREHLDGGGSVRHKRDQLGRLLRGPARAWVHGPGERG